MKIHTIFARLLPRFYWKHIKQLLIFAGETRQPEDFLGKASLTALLLAGVSTIPLLLGFSRFLIVVPLLTLIFVHFLFYLFLYFKVEDRAKRVELYLSDVLQLISTNLRTGMTPFKALRLAARKEFGPLHEEIRFATSRAFGTDSFADSLLLIGKRIKSEVLQRALDLFTTAMKAGGHLSQLLEDLARDIEESRSLKAELVTNVKSSISFIMFSIIFGAPLLFAISIQFLHFISGLKDSTSTATASAGLGLGSGEILISVSFMFWLSICTLVLTSILASLLLGVLREGKITYGFRYVPLIGTGSIVAFFMFRFFIGNFFGTVT